MKIAIKTDEMHGEEFRIVNYLVERLAGCFKASLTATLRPEANTYIIESDSMTSEDYLLIIKRFEMASEMLDHNISVEVVNN